MYRQERQENDRSVLKNTRPAHDIMELLESHPSTQPSTPIRLKNHIAQQAIVDAIFFELARNAAQVRQSNGAIRPAREELVCVVDLGC